MAVRAEEQKTSKELRQKLEQLTSKYKELQKVLQDWFRTRRLPPSRGFEPALAADTQPATAAAVGQASNLQQQSNAEDAFRDNDDYDSDSESTTDGEEYSPYTSDDELIDAPAAGTGTSAVGSAATEDQAHRPSGWGSDHRHPAAAAVEMSESRASPPFYDRELHRRWLPAPAPWTYVNHRFVPDAFATNRSGFANIEQYRTSAAATRQNAVAAFRGSGDASSSHPVRRDGDLHRGSRRIASPAAVHREAGARRRGGPVVDAAGDAQVGTGQRPGDDDVAAARDRSPDRTFGDDAESDEDSRYSVRSGSNRSRGSSASTPQLSRESSPSPDRHPSGGSSASGSPPLSGSSVELSPTLAESENSESAQFSGRSRGSSVRSCSPVFDDDSRSQELYRSSASTPFSGFRQQLASPRLSPNRSYDGWPRESADQSRLSHHVDSDDDDNNSSMSIRSRLSRATTNSSRSYFSRRSRSNESDSRRISEDSVERHHRRRRRSQTDENRFENRTSSASHVDRNSFSESSRSSSHSLLRSRHNRRGWMSAASAAATSRRDDSDFEDQQVRSPVSRPSVSSADLDDADSRFLQHSISGSPLSDRGRSCSPSIRDERSPSLLSETSSRMVTERSPSREPSAPPSSPESENPVPWTDDEVINSSDGEDDDQRQRPAKRRRTEISSSSSEASDTSRHKRRRRDWID
jgi:hypothetical protein